MRIERRRLVKPTRFTEPEEAAERSLESISPVFVKAQSQNTAALIRFKAAHESEGESDITVKKKKGSVSQRSKKCAKVHAQVSSRNN